MENYRVTATELNIRNAPSRDASKIGRLYKNDIIEGIEKSADVKWLKFKKDGIEGWSSLGYLELVIANGNAITESPFDYSKLPFLNGLTHDKKLTVEQSRNFYDNGIVPLCDDKPEFNQARAEGYNQVPDWAQAAPCATTTSAVLEYAFRRAGMPTQEAIFDNHVKFAPTHEVEKMLYRLGFNYWLKSQFKSQKGAIGLMVGRSLWDKTNPPTPKHSGHIYTIFSEVDAKFDLIGDNGGYHHIYQEHGVNVATEGFWLPSGIVPQNR